MGERPYFYRGFTHTYRELTQLKFKRCQSQNQMLRYLAIIASIHSNN